MRRLLVTADDFGLSRAINLGVAEAFRNGIVTRASLAAAGEAFDDAVALAKDLPGLAIGVHLVLTGERPVCPPARVASLVDDAGRFLRTPLAFARRAASGRIDAGEVLLELRAQVERVIAAGLRPAHLDSHCHLAILPSCFRAMVRLAQEHRIPYLRLPLGPLSLESWEWRPSSLLRSALLAPLAARARALRPRLPAGRVACADRVTGLRHSGALDKRRLLDLISRLPDGDTELICHPGTADVGARYAHWRYDWPGELAALTDPAVRERISRESISLAAAL